MKKSILITGGAGYIGSHTAHQMAQQGYEVVIVDTLRHGQTFDHNWATLYEHDFADAQKLKEIIAKHSITSVMHFAAFIEVGQSVKDPRPFYENNVTKTIQLLDTMLDCGIKEFVFSSSCAVYGNPNYLPLDEQHAKNPVSPYGANKLLVEHVLADYSRAYDLRYVSLRYFNAAGCQPELGLGEQHVPETHVIPLILRALNAGTPFKIFGDDYPTKDGTCIRDYIHVSDIARAHMQAADYLGNGAPSQCINLGTGTGYSVKEMIAAAEDVTGQKLDTVVTPRREGDPAVLVANREKAERILGWQPTCSDLKEILASALAWEQRHNFFISDETFSQSHPVK